MHLVEGEALGRAQKAETGGIELAHTVGQEETGHAQWTGTHLLEAMEFYQ